MPNIAYVMNTHNKKVLIYPTKPEKKFCHCIGKARYPLNEKCFRNNILYQEAYHQQKRVTEAKFIMKQLKQYLKLDTRTIAYVSTIKT